MSSIERLGDILTAEDRIDDEGLRIDHYVDMDKILLTALYGERTSLDHVDVADSYLWLLADIDEFYSKVEHEHEGINLFSGKRLILSKYPIRLNFGYLKMKTHSQLGDSTVADYLFNNAMVYYSVGI